MKRGAFEASADAAAAPSKRLADRGNLLQNGVFGSGARITSPLLRC